MARTKSTETKKELTAEELALKEQKKAERKAEKLEKEKQEKLEQEKTLKEIREEFLSFVNNLSDEKLIELDKFTKENYEELPTKYIIEILLNKYEKGEVQFKRMWV